MKHKTNPRLNARDIENYISSKTSLTQPQVKECFRALKDIIQGIAEDSHFNDKITITLPQIGQFYFVKQKGRKRGSTYTVFDGCNEKKTVILTKPKPSYYILRLKVFRRIHDSIMESTKFVEEDE